MQSPISNLQSLVTNSALPSKPLLEAQAEWLAPARARLLRRVGIARRQRILDLGSGYGAVTGELVRRSSGVVVALDRVETAVSHSLSQSLPICGDGLSFPFADNSFDLVFCQCVLMWMGSELETAVSEIHRILESNGVLIALEPDYEGMIEHPPEIATRDIWLSALPRAGAEPRVGQLLPGLLAKQGLEVRVDLLDSLVAPAAERFDFLRTLPLTYDESGTLEQAAKIAGSLDSSWEEIVHLPFFLITATKN